MDEAYRLSQEMGITHANCFPTLQHFLAGQPHTVAGLRVAIPGASGRVEISLSEQRERKIGPTAVFPVTDLESAGYSEEERKAFMHRFETIFRRAGG